MQAFFLENILTVSYELRLHGYWRRRYMQRKHSIYIPKKVTLSIKNQVRCKKAEMEERY